ncbi:DMT family transporter [Patescibacteria group bacterium]
MDSKKINNKLGSLLVLSSALMFGSYGVWSRLIGPEFGNFFQGWTRAVIILILLIPIAIYRKEIVSVKKEDWKWLTIFLIFTSLTQAPIFYAFNNMDIGSASLLFFVSMFLTMYVVGFLFLGEKLNKTKIISSIIAIGGMYLVFSFSITSFIILAAVMAIINGVASGGEVAFSKKLSHKYSPLYLVILSWVIILITNGIISVVVGEAQIIPSLTMPWFWQLCYSIASLLAFWLVIAGFKYIDASIGALIGLMEIVFSVLFGIIIFKESLTLSVGIGAILIITAAILPHLPKILRRSN